MPTESTRDHPDVHRLAPVLAIDCSQVLRTRNRTGIPRVVRNLALHGPDHRDVGIEAWPVVLTFRGYCRVPRSWLVPARRGPLGRLLRSGKMLALAALAFGARACKSEIRTLGNLIPAGLRPLAKRAARGTIAALRKANRAIVRTRAAAGKTFLTLRLWGQRVAFAPGDTLLLCDSNWDEVVLWKWIAELRARGGLVGAVVYDLIPVRRPEFVDAGLYNVFDAHLRRLSRECDFVIGISRETSRDFLDFARSSDRPGWTEDRTGSFRLGAGGWATDASEATPRCTAVLAACAGVPIFLVVGTIEIRKNLSAVLGAFETLWNQGETPALVVVGKPGFGGKAAIEQMLRSPSFGRRLFWLADASDSDLEACYRAAAALIMPSRAEGFGLPVVEALQRGKAVLASDIPTHREIADGFCGFFDPSRQDELEMLVRAHIRNGRGKELRPLEEFKWPAWSESARECLCECRRMIALGARCSPGSPLH
ncbi:MAG: glycosyltransferase [Planctomycetes bacterium]|nr:glycosyltransferase [Planctomycetota bacterium]